MVFTVLFQRLQGMGKVSRQFFLFFETLEDGPLSKMDITLSLGDRWTYLHAIL